MNSVVFDALIRLERTQEVDETLARRTAHLVRDDDLLLFSGRSDLAGFGDEVRDRHVAAAAAGIVDRAVGALVVAAVLHLEESARAVAARKGREERSERFRYRSCKSAHGPCRRVLIRSYITFLLSLLLSTISTPSICRYFLRFELRVTALSRRSRHGDCGGGVCGSGRGISCSRVP